MGAAGWTFLGVLLAANVFVVWQEQAGMADKAQKQRYQGHNSA
jgi:hypothetical protein